MRVFVYKSQKKPDTYLYLGIRDGFHQVPANIQAPLQRWLAALEFDLKKANRILEEVNRVKGEVEKIVEMLRVMDEYMKERIK